MTAEMNRVVRSLRQAVTVVGKLDAIQHSKRRFTLVLNNGQKVRCVLVEGDLAELLPLFGKRVLVHGMGVWHLSGKLDRIEVDRVRSGEEESDFWAYLPQPRFHSELPVEEPSPRPWGLAAVIGKWPGDETDEEIDQALKRIS